MINCSCDYDMPSVWRSSTPRTRKIRQCEECGCKILPGEKYEYVFGVWEGHASSFSTCVDCVGIRVWVKTNIPCFCWGHGNLIEDCRNVIEEAYFQARDEVKGLAFGFGRLLVKARRKRALQRASA